MEENLADTLLGASKVMRFFERYRIANALVLLSRWARATGTRTLDELEKAVESLEAVMPDAAGTEITVNGTRHRVSIDFLTYADVVVHLAGMTGTPSVTWKHRNPPPFQPESGIMHPGCEPIAVSDGMVLNVVHTGNA